MLTTELDRVLFLAALRCLRGWRADRVVRLALEHPGVYRPRARA